MVWQLLAKPLLGVVADGVKGFVETKKAKAELKAIIFENVLTLKLILPIILINSNSV